MQVTRFDIEGVLLFEPTLHKDSRGSFVEVFSEREFEALSGVSTHFVQDNESRSRKYVLRGLHFQKGEWAQAKLVRVARGRVLDVAVDIREGSSTFGKHIAVELSEENHRQLFIPKGFAHGYIALEENTLFLYKCDEYYHPEAEGGIIWNDPTIAIDWGVAESEMIISDKDRGYGLLSDLTSTK